jgi:hypothetical protein
MEQDFSSAQELRDNDFQDFLLASGYEDIGDYDSGPLEITARNQIFTKDGEYWRSSASLTLPYTTTNSWVTDQSNFVSVGDAVLRQDIASPTGASVVGRGSSNVDEDLSAIENKLLIPSITDAATRDLTGIDSVSVLKYSAASLGAKASYKRALSEPSHALKFQDSTGAWFGIDEPSITPQMAGALYDGLTSDSAAFNRASVACSVTGSAFDIGSGVTRCDAALSLPLNVCVVGGDITIDMRSATASIGIHAEGAAWASLPDLSTSPFARARTLVFSAPHGLSQGDVIGIRNPNDGSFNSVDLVARPYYRAGEMCLIKEVVSATEVRLWEPLLAGYSHTVVTMHRLPGDTIDFKVGRLTVLAGAGVTTALQFTRLRNATHDNITVIGGQRNALYRTNCYNIRGSNLICRQSVLSGAGLDYGLVDGSCHKTFARGEFFGQRHGYTAGNGGDLTLPCRFMDLAGIFANDSPAVQSLGAINFHGNCEHYKADGVYHNGGVQFGGDHGKISGRILLSGAGKSAILGTECLGTDYDGSGLHIEAPESNPDSLIRFITSAIAAWTVRGGKINLRDLSFRAPLSVGVLNITISSARVATDPIQLDISGAVFYDIGPSATAIVNTSGANPVRHLICRDSISYEPITWTVNAGTTVLGTLPT